MNGFAAALETALDRNAANSPNIGQVASHRLNRAEYVNAIHDLLALDVNGAELLPGDMAGFGFDNNASVLAVTPSLMSRYMSAATKISRVAVGSADNRAVTKVYETGFGTRQNARMGEEMPFGTHGGLAIRHTFPLDGEYILRIRLNRSGAGGSGEGNIVGIEDADDIDLRVDRLLVKHFSVGGEFKGPDPGTLIGIAEDDTEGKRVHDYHMNADKDLQIRIPVKAGNASGRGGLYRFATVAHRQARRQHRLAGDFGALQRQDARGHAQPQADFRLPSRQCQRRGTMRAEDHHHPDAARLPAPRDRARD